MNARLPTSRLIIVGDGPLRGQVESYISRHRLPNVVMAGFVPDTVLPRYYCSADIFCAPATALRASESSCWRRWPQGCPSSPRRWRVICRCSSRTRQPDSAAQGLAELGSALIILAATLTFDGGWERTDAKRPAGSGGKSSPPDLEVYEEAREAAAGREAQAAHIEEINVHDAV